MNKVCLVGRSTKDWELKFTSGNGTATVQNSIAVQRDIKNAQGNYDSDFINIVVWGKTAEFIVNHTAKGKLVELEGRIQTRNYKNKNDDTVYVTEVVADKIRPIEWVKNEGTSGQTQSSTQQQDEDMTYVGNEGDIPF